MGCEQRSEWWYAVLHTYIHAYIHTYIHTYISLYCCGWYVCIFIHPVGELVSSVALPTDSWKHKQRQMVGLSARGGHALCITQDKYPQNAAELTELFGVPKERQNLDPMHVEKQITETMSSFCSAFKEVDQDNISPLAFAILTSLPLSLSIGLYVDAGSK